MAHTVEQLLNRYYNVIDYPERFAIMRALGETRDPVAANFLTDELATHNPDELRACIDGLEAFGEAIVPTLRALMDNEEEPIVARNAAIALVRRGDASAVQALLGYRLLSEPFTTELFADLVGRDALLAMCTLDYFEDEDRLKPVLRFLVKRAALIRDELDQALLAPDGPCRVYGPMAVAILAKIADERAIATLVRGLGGKADARVRRAIIWAVDEQGIDSDAVFDALAERAADRNEPRELRKDALQLLLDAEPDPRWEPLVRQALDGGLRLTVSASRAKSLDALLGERHPNVQVPGEG